jgi:hypothetical protein
MDGIQGLERYVCTLYDTRDQLKRHIFDRADQAFEAGDRARDEIADTEQLEARKAKMKEAFLSAMGELPPTGSPLHAKTTRTVQGTGYTVDNVIFESLPGHYVTANLYLPDRRVERSAAVLFLCGHEYEGKHSPYYHSVCLRFVRAGFVVMAIDPIGQGERLSFCRADNQESPEIWGTREHQHFGVKCHTLGESVARYFIHDAMRAVDYLSERPEVDPSRIAVTGNSGGGTQTAMLMACDDRIAAAAPATFIMNRRQYMHAGGVQDAEQVWPGLTAAGFDHEDLLLLFAPKPLIILAAQYDFFPIEATRRTVARSRRFWELYGKSECLQLAEDRSTHRYTDKLADAAAQFFHKHLSPQLAAPLAERELLAPLSAEQLICTSKGQVLLSVPDAKTIHDEIAARCDDLWRSRTQTPPEQRRSRALEWLREKVVSLRNPCDLNPRIVSLGETDGLSVQYALWWSQADLMNSGYLLRSASAGIEAKQPVTVGLWQGGTTSLSPHWPWIRETCGQGRTVLVLNCSGIGPHQPYPIYGKPARPFFGVNHKLADDLIWLGDSVAALRTYDVIRCIEAIKELNVSDEKEIDCYTVGCHSLYARLASALDERIGRIMTENPLHELSAWVQSERYEEEDVMDFVMPGILKHLELSELNAQTAKRTR